MEMPLIARFSRDRAHAILVLDVGNELLQEKIAVGDRTVGGIDIETPPAFRGNDEKLADLVLPPEIIDQRPSPGVEQRLLVFAETVQKIKNGISRRRMFARAAVIVCRQVHAVMDH